LDVVHSVAIRAYFVGRGSLLNFLLDSTEDRASCLSVGGCFEDVLGFDLFLFDELSSQFLPLPFFAFGELVLILEELIKRPSFSLRLASGGFDGAAPPRARKAGVGSELALLVLLLANLLLLFLEVILPLGFVPFLPLLKLALGLFLLRCETLAFEATHHLRPDALVKQVSASLFPQYFLSNLLVPQGVVLEPLISNSVVVLG